MGEGGGSKPRTAAILGVTGTTKREVHYQVDRRKMDTSTLEFLLVHTGSSSCNLELQLRHYDVMVVATM